MGRNGFFVAGGDVPEVREFDTTGQLTRILRLGEVPRPVTPEDIVAVVDSMASRFTVAASQARRVYEQMEIPEQWPTFQSLRVDELGWVWAEVYQPLRREASRWMIFDQSGVARGILELASDFELHDVGTDYVLGRWRDDLGIEYVRRYRLNRGN
jgi:hypothetical protein